MSKRLNKAIEHINGSAKAIIFGRNGYSPPVQKFLKQHGTDRIKEIHVKRYPISETITKVLQGISGTYHYDQLFHLKLYIICHSGLTFTIEKNEVITVTMGMKQPRPHEETMKVPNRFNVQIQQFLNNAQQKMGDRYFRYRADLSNCQDFVLGLLTANGVTDTNVKNFVKQDTEHLFNGHPIIRHLLRTATNLAGKVIDPMIHGGTVSKKKTIKIGF